MRKIIILILLFFNIKIFANPIDSVLAKKIALHYFEFLIPDKYPLEILNTVVKYYNGNISYYVINFNGGGYIIVSGNDAAPPILCYSYDNIYIESELSPAHKFWL